MAGADQACSQLDVLSGRPLVAFVESARVQEHRAADRAAAGPEGAGATLALLVNEAVHQVFVLGDEIRLGRLVVVGADQRVELGVVSEGVRDLFERVGLDLDVGVDEEQDFPLGEGCGDVAGVGWALALGDRDDPGAVGFGDFGGIVPGAIVRY